MTSCWFHTWTNWSAVYTERASDPLGRMQVRKQKRRCTGCNMIETRTVDTGFGSMPSHPDFEEPSIKLKEDKDV